MGKTVAPRSRPRRKPAVVLSVLLALSLVLAACSSDEPPAPAGTGFLSIALADAPSLAFDNVWITVREIWFSANATAPFDSSSSVWHRVPLDNAVTVDLTGLSADNVMPVPGWDNVAIPSGTYRQILLFLASTEEALDNAAETAGLSFNNQVDVDSTFAAVPLRVPNAEQGIRIPFEFTVTDNGTRRFAIDFDLIHDVVPFDRSGRTEFILKPRLRIFDLDNAGAIVGHIDNTAAGDNTALFAVKAETFDTAVGGRVLRRAAAVDNATGRFVLYPVDLDTYDIVITGRGWQTVFIKSVPATVRATPASGATILGTAGSPIPMFASLDYRINVAINLAGPTGAWANFYQTAVGTGETPILVHTRHFDPFSGRFDDFPLSLGPLRVDTFNAGLYNGGNIVLTPILPVGDIGVFTVAAEADFYLPSVTPASANANVTPAFAGNDFSIPALFARPSAILRTVSGTVFVPAIAAPLDNLVVFATRGGMIVNAQGKGSVPPGGGDVAGGYSTLLPGGETLTPFPLGVYRVSSYGWSNLPEPGLFWVGVPNKPQANLQVGDDTVNILTLDPAP